MNSGDTVQAIAVDPSGAVTLQSAYDASGAAQPKIEVSAANGALTIRDAAAPIGDLLILEDNAGVDFFNVDPLQINYGIATQRLLEFNQVIAGYGGITWYPDDFTRTVVGQTTNQWTSTLTTAIPGGGGIGNDTAPNFVNWAGEVIMTEQGNLFNTQSLFAQSTVITCQGANTGPIYTMINQPNLRTGSAGGSRTGSQQNAVRSQLSIGPNVAGNFTLTSHEPYFAVCTVNASVGTAAITTVNYFAPKAPNLLSGGTIGTLHVLDIPNIPAAGISSLVGIASSMSSGTFIEQLGTAPIQLAGGGIHTNDGIPIQFGGTAFNSQDASLFWSASGWLELFFAANSDSMEISNAVNNQIVMAGDTASMELALDFQRGLTIGQAGSLANQFINMAQPALTVPLAGDWSGVLLTQAGNLSIGALAMGRVSAWVVNGTSYAAGTGTVANSDTMTIGGMATSSPGITITERQSLHVIAGRSRFQSAMQYDPINPAALSAGDNNNWAGLLTGTANNGMRHWARVTPDGGGTSVITGIDSTSAQDGDTFKLTNIGTVNLTIGHQDAGSLAANRIASPTVADYVLAANQSAELIYDTTSSRWRILYGSGA